MDHAITYHGQLELNLSSLHPGTTRKYQKPGGEQKEVIQPKRAIDGIVFIRMQKGSQEFIVAAGSFLASDPIPIVAGRHHGGAGLGVQPSIISDECARNILSDLRKTTSALRHWFHSIERAEV